MKVKNLRKAVFLPTFIGIVLLVILSVVCKDAYFTAVNAINFWIKSNLGWLFVLVTTFLVILSIVIFFSPLGKRTIGGEGAVPLLKTWDWFAITLCTTVAAGLMFWAAAEPLTHYMNPPEFLGITPGTNEALMFAMSTSYVNWAFTPYAIFCVVALMFALAYYNMGQPYSFRGCIVPTLGERQTKRYATLLDAICLLVMGLGLSASLGTGIMSVSGGINNITGLSKSGTMFLVVGIAIAVTFIISSTTGLMKGIRFLSSFNIWLYIFIIAMMFIFSDTFKILDLIVESFGYYLDNFFTRSMITGTMDPSNWNHYWTASYFGNWMTWAPLTGLFLGRIAYGHSVKSFITMNLFIPAGFTILWFGIFGGTTIFAQNSGVDLYNNVLVPLGAESALYAVLDLLPLSEIMAPVLLLATFLSFVTAADSTTNAMAGLSWKGVNPLNPEAPGFIKISLGVLIVAVAVVMVNGAGIVGIKILTAMGSVPALLLIILCTISIIGPYHAGRHRIDPNPLTGQLPGQQPGIHADTGLCHAVDAAYGGCDASAQ